MGAYLSTFAPYIPTVAGTGVLASVYGFQAVYANVIGVFTNTVPVDAYRGAGRPESNYLVERMIDAAARELKIDRIELRRRNMVGPSAMPHTTPVGKVYDSGDFRIVLDAGLKNAEWAGFAARRAEAERRGKRRGIGLSYYLEATGGAPTERAEIRFADDGFVDVFVGTQSTGQGHETAYVQLTVDRLGVPGEKVRVKQGDTDTIPTGGGTGGARSLYSEGQAILVTAATVIEKGKKAAAEALEAAPADIVFEQGRFSIVGTDRGMDILTLAATQRGTCRQGRGRDDARCRRGRRDQGPHLPQRLPHRRGRDRPGDRRRRASRATASPTMSAAPSTRWSCAGRCMAASPRASARRCWSAPAMTASSGQLLSGSFMDYALPRADDLPDIKVDLVEVPCVSNPLGVKGAGEAGAVGSPPAVINAIIDALSGDGVTHIDMPATPEAVWRALGARKAA